MAYSAPPTKSVGDTLAAADWNTYVRDNMIDLAARLLPVEYAIHVAELTTTSTTYIDVTDLSVNISPTRQSTILMVVSGNTKAGTSPHAAAFQGVIDSVVDDVEVSSATQSYVPLGYVYARTGKAAGTYTVKLTWKSTNAGSTAYAASLNMFVVAIPEA